MNSLARTTTRRFALVAACAAFIALPLLAQDTPPPAPPTTQMQGPPPGGPGGGRGGMNPEHRLQMMKEQLGLTDQQTAKIKAILDEGRGKMEGVRADTSLSREDMRSKSREIMEHESKHIREVLNADQQPKYDAMVERMRHRGPGGPGGPGGTGQEAPPASPQGTPQQ